jgi:hypothetical protein
LAELDETPKGQSFASLVLSGGASSGQEMSYEQNDCDHEQQMDRSERHVECDKSKQPQDEQNSGDSSEHDSSLIRPNFQTLLTIRFEQKIGYRGKPLMGGMACCNYRPYIDLRGFD